MTDVLTFLGQLTQDMMPLGKRVQALPGNDLLRDLPLNSMLWERCLAMAFIRPAQIGHIVIVFDRSGSMSDDPHVNSFSERIDLARAAVANLLTGLDDAATQVDVLVVDFASSAASSG